MIVPFNINSSNGIIYWNIKTVPVVAGTLIVINLGEGLGTVISPVSDKGRIVLIL